MKEEDSYEKEVLALFAAAIIAFGSLPTLALPEQAPGAQGPAAEETEAVKTFAAPEEGTVRVEGEDYASLNFDLYEDGVDAALSGGRFLLMKSLTGEEPPEEGYLAAYTVGVATAGEYAFAMTCLVLDGHTGSTIEVSVNGGEFAPFSDANAERLDKVEGASAPFYHYGLGTVDLQAGDNTLVIKIATPRSQDSRYYFYLDCMDFTLVTEPEPEPEPEPAGTVRVEGEHYKDVNFFLHDYDKDEQFSNGDILMMKSLPGEEPPAGGFLAGYEVEIPQAGTYRFDMVCLKLDGDLGSTIEVSVNGGEFVPYSEATVKPNHYVAMEGPYRNNFYHYTLGDIALLSGTNTVEIKIATPRTGGRYFYYLDYMDFTRVETSVPDDTIFVEGEHYDDVNFTIYDYAKDPALSGGDFLHFKSLAGEDVPEDGFWVEYTVTAPKTGAYAMDITSLPINGQVGSPIEISVNGGGFVRYSESNAQRYGVIDSAVYPNTFIQYHLGTVVLNEGDNRLVIRITEKRPSDERCYFYLDVMGFTPLDWSIGGVKPLDAPVGVYQLGETVRLWVDYHLPATGVEQLEYRLVDYWGGVADEGIVRSAAGAMGQAIEVEGLERGHYTAYVRAVGSGEWAENTLAVVTPLADRPEVPQSPFALDAAMLMTYYKMPNFSLETAVEYADALALAGVDTTRERYRWNDDTNPAPGSYNFDVYDTDIYLNRLAEHGIEVLDMFSSAPAWTREGGGGMLASDLVAAYQFARDSAEYYDGVVTAWEMANEPELANTAGHETADRLAAYIKAAAIGYMDASADVDISMPGLAYTPQYYGDLLMQNGILDFVDIYNYHNHVALNETENITYPSEIYRMHEMLLDRYDGQGMPMWLSEAGTYVSLQSGMEDLTHEQQVLMARYLVVSTIASLASGTDKHFFFNLTYLVEHDRELGIFGTRDTPYAPYAAEAALTEALGEGRYLGALRGVADGAYAHAFADGGDTVLAIWADVPQTLTVPATGAALLTDIMGGRSEISAADGRIAVEAGYDPVYLRVPGTLAQGALVVTHRPEAAAANTLTTAQRVVLEQRYSQEAAAGSKVGGYALAGEGENLVTVRVHNLNGTEMTGSIEGAAYAGWQVSPASRPVTVAPYATAEVTFAVTATEDVILNTSSPVQFKGRFGGEETSNSVAHVVLKGEENPDVYRLVPGADNANAWEVNVTENGGSSRITAGERPGSVQFAHTFASGDRWTYPQLTMPSGTDFTGTKGLTLMVDFDRPLTAVEGVMRVLITEEGGAGYWTAEGFQLPAGPTQITIPWTSFTASALGTVDNNFNLDLDQIATIQLGVNFRVDDAPTYTVWDFGTYLGADDALYATVTGLVPANDSVLASGTNARVSAVIQPGEIAMDTDTLKVTLNGKVLNHSYNKETGLVEAETGTLPDGIHTVNVQFFSVDGRGVLGTTRVEVAPGGTTPDPGPGPGPEKPDPKPDPDPKPGGKPGPEGSDGEDRLGGEGPAPGGPEGGNPDGDKGHGANNNPAVNTGDSSNTAWWAVLGGIGLAGILTGGAAALHRRKKTKDKT